MKFDGYCGNQVDYFFLEHIIQYVWLCRGQRPTRMVAEFDYKESYE